jgi:hypothetical protein
MGEREDKVLNRASRGGTNLDTRAEKLGILYAGPQHSATGEIEVIDVPNVAKPVAVSKIPYNLGIVLRVYALLAFEPIPKRHDEEYDDNEVK